jgi:23S rRNA (cytosine1962-C5)-methyltransferase
MNHIHNELIQHIQTAVELRLGRFPFEPEEALRLFNGFYESIADLVIERYAQTLVLLNHEDQSETLVGALTEIQAYLLSKLQGIECILVKTRRSPDPDARKGLITFGIKPAGWIQENGVKYTLDLQLNQDTSFYLDTRNLRYWLKNHSANWNVLNCFAYTGSLGVAALAGGARRVTQLDISRKFLGMAEKTCSLNGFHIENQEFLVGDFFRLTGRLRKEGAKFDSVILDAPYFSSGNSTSLNLQQDSARLINKVRPLVKDGGYLIAINNSLFLSGKDYLDELKKLGENGCLEVVETIPVPDDITGTPQTIIRKPPTDPAPFNHPTKIAVFKIRRK